MAPYLALKIAKTQPGKNSIFGFKLADKGISKRWPIKINQIVFSITYPQDVISQKLLLSGVLLRGNSDNLRKYIRNKY